MAKDKNEFYEFVDAKEIIDLCLEAPDSIFVKGKYILDFNSGKIVELSKSDFVTVLEAYHGNNNYAMVKKITSEAK